jgi:hypothetical protein
VLSDEGTIELLVSLCFSKVIMSRCRVPNERTIERSNGRKLVKNRFSRELFDHFFEPRAFLVTPHNGDEIDYPGAM